QTSPFTGVDASGIMTVYLTQGEVFSVAVEADEALQSNVETSVEDGVLFIESTNNLRRAEKVMVYVSAPEINYLKGSGAVSFRGENPLQTATLEVNVSGTSGLTQEVNVDNLISRISGASNVTFTGSATMHDFSLSGASVLRADNLATQTTHAELSGAATGRISASEYLKAQASGTSSLTYAEKPARQQVSTSGMARIGTGNGESEVVNMEQDTVRVRIMGREIIISDGGSAPHVDIKKDRWREFKGNWGGFEMGINGYLNADRSLELADADDYMDLRYEKSVAVNINMFQQSFNLISNNLGLVTGIGLSWNNYRFADDITITPEPDGIEPLQPNEEYNYRKSKLTLLYLNLPLMMEFQTQSPRSNQQFHLAGGIITGIRLRSHTKQVYNLDGKKNKDKNFDDFHLRPFRFDATARIGWGKVNLFANYSLTSLFRDDKGPELYPFTVGIRILRW
ncbi:MAG: head GIN domain-containing protein, partial [Bacteroidales bacterium]